jgi:hypothetical protein
MLLAPGACDVPEWFDAAWQRTQGLGITALAPDMRAPALTAWICETLGLS